ncbi:MAG: hypothetical protein WC551_07755 [Patescibacteria group bacterium]
MLSAATTDEWYFMGWKVAADGNTVTGFCSVSGGGTITDVVCDTSSVQIDTYVTTLYMLHGFDGYWLNGAIENLKIWSAVLTNAELVEEMWSYEPVRSSGLWARIPLNDISSAAFLDTSGNGHNATKIGSPTAEASPPYQIAVTGTAAGILPTLVGAAVAVHMIPVTGTAAGDLPGLVGEATMWEAVPVTGTAAGILATLAGSAAGYLPITGTAAGILSGLTGAATASTVKQYTFYHNGFVDPGTHDSGYAWRYWVNGQRGYFKDNGGNGELFAIEDDQGSTNRLHIIKSTDGGATWTWVSPTGSLASYDFTGVLYQGGAQDSSGKLHLAFVSTATVTYMRVVLTRTDGAITGLDYEATFNLPGTYDATGDIWSCVEIVTTASSVECVLICSDDRPASPGTGIRTQAVKSSSITPATATDFTKLDGTAGATVLLTHATANSHEHHTLFAQCTNTRDVWLFLGSQFAEGGPDGSGLYLSYLRLTASGGTWTVGSLTATPYGNSVTQKTTLQCVIGTDDYVWVVMITPADGICLDRVNASGYTHKAIPCPDTGTEQIGWCVAQVSADGTNAFAVWDLMSPTSTKYGAYSTLAGTWTTWTESRSAYIGDSWGMAKGPWVDGIIAGRVDETTHYVSLATVYRIEQISVSGAAGVLPGLTGAATGTETISGTAVGSLVVLAGSAQAVESIPGTAAGVLNTDHPISLIDHYAIGDVNTQNPGVVLHLSGAVPETQVTFGGTPAAAIVVDSSAQVTVTTPSLAYGEYVVLAFSAALRGAVVASEIFTGTAAGVLPSPLVGLAGMYEDIPGTASGVLPGLVGAAVGTVNVAPPVTGTAAGALPTFTGASAAMEFMVGAAAGVLPTLVGDASASEGVTGTATGALSTLAGAATASEDIPGISAGTLSTLTGFAQGSSVEAGAINGTAAGDLPTLAGASTASEDISATAIGVLPTLTGVSAGYASIFGQAAANVQTLVGAAAGIESISGPAAGVLQTLVGDAIGSRVGPDEVTGTAAANLVTLVGTGGAYEDLPGTAAGTLPGLTGSASGEVSIHDVLATADGILPNLSGDALGWHEILGTADGVLPTLTGASIAYSISFAPFPNDAVFTVAEPITDDFSTEDSIDDQTAILTVLTPAGSSTMLISRKTKDTRPLVVSILSNGVALPLTGITSVVVNIRRAGSATYIQRRAACTITEPATGTISYAWQPDDLAVPDLYIFEFVLLFSDGTETVLPVADLTMTVEPRVVDDAA